MAGIDEQTPRPSRAKKACVECRQQKARCDSHLDPDNVCSRCRKLGIDCRISGDFKREHKRQKLTQLMHDTDLLRQRLDAQENISPSNIISKDASPGESYVARGSGSHAPSAAIPQHNGNGTSNGRQHQMSVNPTESFDERLYPKSTPPEQYSNSTEVDTTSTLPRDLDEIHFDPPLIDNLFAIYFRDFDRHLPVVNAAASPNQVYKCSKILFWGIIAVAIRAHRGTSPARVELISDKVCDIVVEALKFQIASFHSIKGLILLQNWPFACSHSRRCAHHALMGSLLHLGMRIGLHVPTRIADFSGAPAEVSEIDISNRTRLWGCCLVTYLRFCNWKGFSPMTFSSANGPEQSQAMFYCLPSSVRLQLRLEELKARAASALAQNGLGILSPHQENAMTILLSVFEGQIRDIELDAVTDLDRFHVSLARLAIQTYHFYKDLTSLDPVIVAQLYITSSLLIKQMDSFESNGIPLRSCPTYFTFAALLAVTTLGRILMTSLSRHLDKKEGEAVYRTGVSVIERFSVEPDDIAARLGSVVRRLWEDPMAFKTADGKDVAQLRVRSRLATSAAYDALMTQIRKDRNADKLILCNTEDQPATDPPLQDNLDLPLDNPFMGQMFDFNFNFNDDFLFLPDTDMPATFNNL